MAALTCCDKTTSPDGQPVLVEQRLAEIHDRYGPGHLASRFIQRATPMILRAASSRSINEPPRLSRDNEDSSVRVPELRRGIFVVNPRPSLCPVCAF